MTAVVDDESLLACVEVGTENKIVIQTKDRPFWDYYYAKEHYFTTHHTQRKRQPHSIKCKPYLLPPTAALRNLSRPDLPEDMIRLIASFGSAVHCNTCGFVTFNMNFLVNCSTPSTRHELLMVQKRVAEEGGDCKVRMRGQMHHEQGADAAENVRTHTSWAKPLGRKYSQWKRASVSEYTLQRCMRGNGFDLSGEERRVFAACQFKPASRTQRIIKYLEKYKTWFADFLASRKQDSIHAKHIFEGL